jgi:enterochelin esterase-like enzyme
MKYVVTIAAVLGCLMTLGAQQQGATDANKAKAKGGGLIRPLADVEHDIKGKIERIKVHGKSLEGNLEGDSADREVFVYLPPSYGRDTNKRYPVVYMLHGYGLHAEQWVGFINVASAEKYPKEMIVVMPDAFTVHNGSFYSNSATTGDWEKFIAVDLVSYVDSHYRTKANRASRGLGGHSMGGYGTFRIGMKYPDVFSSLYSMSAGGVFEDGASSADLVRAESIKTKDEEAKLPYTQKSPFARGAAWSANPNNPPFYLDLATKDGKTQARIAAKWMQNSLLVMAQNNAAALKKMKSITMDVGLQDNLVTTNRELDQLLADLGVKHAFETFEGDHNGKVPERFDTKVLPYFAAQLEF